MLKELLSNYSLTQIFLFIVALAVAFKKVADFIDWLHGKITQRDKKTIAAQENMKLQEERLKALEANTAEVKEAIVKIGEKVDILMHSDKDAIKAWITKEHHYFCYQKGWIDDYSLDCLERRYGHYVEENGNSFIANLMDEVRDLPKQPPG